jgi:hypothetical protein
VSFRALKLSKLTTASTSGSLVDCLLRMHNYEPYAGEQHSM